MEKGFTKKELEEYRKLGLDAILLKTVTGFNYYPKSIEKESQNMIHIPIKYGHRSIDFLNLLGDAVNYEFRDKVSTKIFPRKVIYQWLKTYNFPKPEESINIFDVGRNLYIHNEEEYLTVSNRLLAEGDEQSLVFIPKNMLTLIDLTLFLVSRGSFYLTDEEGQLIPALEDSDYPFKLNPDRLGDEAYITPMIITSYDKTLESKLNGFSPVRKLFKLKGNEEISVYLDKSYDEFVEKCKIIFDGPVLKLANKLFKDFINLEEIF